MLKTLNFFSIGLKSNGDQYRNEVQIYSGFKQGHVNAAIMPHDPMFLLLQKVGLHLYSNEWYMKGSDFKR